MGLSEMPQAGDIKKTQVLGTIHEGIGEKIATDDQTEAQGGNIKAKAKEKTVGALQGLKRVADQLPIPVKVEGTDVIIQPPQSPVKIVVGGDKPSVALKTSPSEASSGISGEVKTSLGGTVTAHVEALDQSGSGMSYSRDQKGDKVAGTTNVDFSGTKFGLGFNSSIGRVGDYGLLSTVVTPSGNKFLFSGDIDADGNRRLAGGMDLGGRLKLNAVAGETVDASLEAVTGLGTVGLTLTDVVRDPRARVNLATLLPGGGNLTANVDLSKLGDSSFTFTQPLGVLSASAGMQPSTGGGEPTYTAGLGGKIVGDVEAGVSASSKEGGGSRMDVGLKGTF